MRRYAQLLVLLSTLLPAVASAGPPTGRGVVRPPAATVTRLTRKVLSQRFPGRGANALRQQAHAAQWKPSSAWLAGEGKKYGVLLAVSDTHPGPGLDPITGKLNNAEDFKAAQEVQFRAMLDAEWKQGAVDGKVRTLILNGDTLEFMQTSTPPEGRELRGTDAYGPTNTARNARIKLQTIAEGHPLLFRTYGEHLAGGHKIVIMPGNHDRQLTNPAVRGALRRVIVDSTAMHLLGVDDLNLAPRAERIAAVAKARALVKQNFEFAPPVFMHGDVIFVHGNQTDPANAFRSFLGDWYESPIRSRNQIMEAAWGDYFVKSVFNEVEQKIPWGDNDMNRVELAFKTMKQDHGIGRALIKVAKGMKYTWTREGHGSVAEEAAIQAQGERDLGRMVKDTGMTAKVNELRRGAGKPPLSEAEVTDAMVEYHETRAQPILMMFPKEAGAFKRAVIAFKRRKEISAAFDSKTVEANELKATTVLLGRLGIKTKVTGHDHLFRDERYLVEDAGGGKTFGRLVDTATWTDGIETIGGVQRRRGVARIEFGPDGSKTALYDYDPASGYVTAQPSEATSEGLDNLHDVAR